MKIFHESTPIKPPDLTSKEDTTIAFRNEQDERTCVFERLIDKAHFIPIALHKSRDHARSRTVNFSKLEIKGQKARTRNIYLQVRGLSKLAAVRGKSERRTMLMHAK